jgi:transcriptional regulator with XRE-family HTH domain
MQRFGEKLRSLRTQHGWTYQQLADALGYAAPSYVYEIEAGKKTPTVAFVIKVARLFQVTTDALVFDEVELDSGTGSG